jgi:hypothetical protein
MAERDHSNTSPGRGRGGRGGRVNPNPRVFVPPPTPPTRRHPSRYPHRPLALTLQYMLQHLIDRRVHYDAGTGQVSIDMSPPSSGGTQSTPSGAPQPQMCRYCRETVECIPYRVCACNDPICLECLKAWILRSRWPTICSECMTPYVGVEYLRVPEVPETRLQVVSRWLDSGHYWWATLMTVLLTGYGMYMLLDSHGMDQVVSIVGACIAGLVMYSLIRILRRIRRTLIRPITETGLTANSIIDIRIDPQTAQNRLPGDGKDGGAGGAGGGADARGV